MSHPKLLDEIEGIILDTSPKAVKILAEFKAIWIPKSVIVNLGNIELYNTEDVQHFVVSKWVLEENEMGGY